MKTNLHSRKAGAFTLIEMVGVLAVIALLAAILVPKVFSAITNARYANTISSLNAVKTACTDYYGKYGKFAGVNGASLPTGQANAWDTVLVGDNFLERKFECRLGTRGAEQIMLATSDASTTAPSAETYPFKLDGTNTIGGNKLMLVAKIPGVSGADAFELSQRVDGDAMSTSEAALDDKGRVAYAAPTGTPGRYHGFCLPPPSLVHCPLRLAHPNPPP
jgi:type II secretory pathway pseudopilin PulG